MYEDEHQGKGAQVKDRPPKRIKFKAKPPKHFKVIYHNDDYTPMEFVAWTIMEIFNRSEVEANSLTFEVHKAGKAIVGIYDFQTAETKISDVLQLAKEHEFPLNVTGEPVD